MYKKPTTDAVLGSQHSVSDIGTTAAQIAAANRRRRSLVIQNQGTTTLYLGFSSSVTTSDFAASLQGGISNRDGQGGAWATEGATVNEGAVWGIRASGTAGVSIEENTDVTT